MEKTSKHQSILVSEIISLLEVKPGGIYIDATFGGGGHTQALLEASGPTGQVIAFDRDPATKQFADQLSNQYGQRFQYHPVSYVEIRDYVNEADGVLFDLGFSSDQLESSERGFSFTKSDEPLDLRFDNRSGQTAAQFLQQAPLPKIEKIFREYAQDRYWRRLAKRIVEDRRYRPIKTVADFVEYVGTDQPAVLAPLFQALRIVVNDELGTVKAGIEAAEQAVKPGGRIAVLTFHSLEDKIVKEALRSSEFEVITRKPIVPSEREIKENPRSRSAKLRVAAKI